MIVTTAQSTDGGGLKHEGGRRRVIVSSNHGAHEVVSIVAGRSEQRFTAKPH